MRLSNKESLIMPRLLEQAEEVANQLQETIDMMAKAAKPYEYDDMGPQDAEGIEPEDGTGDRNVSDDDDNEDDDKVTKVATTVATTGPHALPHHKFQTVTARISAARNLPLTTAAQVARKENPELFADYQSKPYLQGNLAGQPSPIIASIGIVTAPSFDRLVQAEVAKGCSENVAKQRVAYSHPHLARESIAKSEGGDVVAFMNAVTEIQKRDDCSRVEALRKARVEHPHKFGRYQNVA
jgi:hypothetical protein